MRALCLAVLAVVLSHTAAFATLVGDTFTVDYFYPNLSTAYAPVTYTPKTFVVGPGIETVVRVEDVTSLILDISADGLTVRFETTLTDPTWTASPFNGLVLTTASQLEPKTPVVLGDTTLAGFDAARVTLTDHEIRLNWNGLSYVNGTFLDVGFVPEPASFTLLGAGLAGIGLVRRRRVR